MSGAIYPQRLRDAAVQFSEAKAAWDKAGQPLVGELANAVNAAMSRLHATSLEYAISVAKPRAPRMHEAGASQLWGRLGFSPPSTGGPLLVIADWFNENTDELT